MRVKKIIPRREKLKETKTTEITEDGGKKVVRDVDFFRIIPEEGILECDGYGPAVKEIFKIQSEGKCEGESGDESGGESGGVLLVASKNARIIEDVRDSGLKPIVVSSQPEIIRRLEELYAQRIRPEGIVFDYNNTTTNVHVYVRDLYINSNLHIFRNLPIAVFDYSGDGLGDGSGDCSGDGSPLIDKINVLAMNASPRKNGNTKRLLNEEMERYWTGPYYESSVVDLEYIEECANCGGMQRHCTPDCIYDDQMEDILPKLKEADVLLLGSPVYMDTPTARTVALLSRLGGQTKHNRRAFIGKYASVLTPAWCSGTKSVIDTLIGALELLGFTIQGRSTREYIDLWQDGKTRGGVPHDYFWPK